MSVLDFDEMIWQPGFEEERLTHEKEMKERRYRVVLDSGQVIFKCGKCHTSTIGSVGRINDRPRFKINLKGSRALCWSDSLDALYYHTTNQSIEMGDSLSKRKSVRAGGVARFEEYEPDRQTGGKCQCGRVHRFFFEEMAESMGFVSCAKAINPYVDKTNYLWLHRYNLTGRFLAIYVQRSDVDLQSMFSQYQQWDDDELLDLCDEALVEFLENRWEKSI